MAKEMVSIYERMLLVVREIPLGRVATYGQIAWIAGAASPRMAGYALGGLPAETDVPWQRVVNGKGGVSPRGDPLATDRQRRLLMEEGVRFEADGRVNLDQFGWEGPDPEWLEANDFSLLPWRARG